MLTKTSAIVLNSIKYGDSGKIMRLYTESNGIKSFFVQSTTAKNKKNNAVFFPLNQVELVYDDKPRSSLQKFKEVNTDVHYKTLFSNPAKITIALFLTEILNSVLKEEEANPKLFQFIQISILEFDKKETQYSDFHLWFLINLSRFLGFFPHFEKSYTHFDLTNGVSSHEIPEGHYINGEELQTFEKLVSLDFLNNSDNQFSQNQRKLALSTLIKYFELHITDFRPPKSLEVLGEVFD